MSSRVVITGLGVLAPLGSGWPAFERALFAGRSGVGPITLFDARSLPVRIGGEVRELDPARLCRARPQLADLDDRKVFLGWEAAEQAMADADWTREISARALVSVGVSLESFSLVPLAPATRTSDASARIRMLIASGRTGWLQTPLDCLAQTLADAYGFDRGRHTNCSACAAGAQAIGEAFHRLREGEAPAALAGAADSILNPLGLGGFGLLRVLSTENDRPQEACRPFDATREGTVLGEGAAFVALETLEHAQARGATLYAEVMGYGASLDAYRVSDPEPSGRGAALAMRQALRDAAVSPEEVDAINAHGTGTPKNDLAETRAIKETLGERAHRIPVSAVKSMTGHLIAASGAVEAVASVLTLWRGRVPPTINRRHLDPECDLDYVTAGSRPFTGRTVLSNSFGFGGQNAALLFRRL